jgi:hypothetical protein
VATDLDTVYARQGLVEGQYVSDLGCDRGLADVFFGAAVGYGSACGVAEQEPDLGVFLGLAL